MKQQTQIIVLIVLVVIAAAILGAQYWPSAGGKSGTEPLFTVYQRLDFPKPEIQWERIELRRKVEYKATGIDIFSMNLPPPPVVPVKVPQPGEPGYVQPAPVPPPPAQLPQDMKFFGYGTVPNGTPRRAFLSYQDDVLIVSEGDTLIGRFRILKINNATLEFEELATGQRGQKIIEDQGPSA
jgi:hypothetical protein